MTVTDLSTLAGSPWVWLLVVLLFAAASAVVRRGRLSQRTRRRGRWDIARTVAERSLSAASPEAVLRPVAEALPALLGATNAQILLVDSDQQQLAYVVGAKGRPRGSVSMSTISGPVTCFRARETTEVEDAEHCPFIAPEWVAKRKLKSALYVPILSADACVGVVEIEDRARRRGFDEEQIALAEHLAKIAELGLRLHDQRTMTEQLHRSEKLVAVSELASAMAAELDGPFEEAERLIGSREIDPSGRLAAVAAQLQTAREALQRLVRFATPSSTEKIDVDLNAVVERVAADRRLGEDGRGTVKLSLSDRTPYVSADPSHLEQVFQILFRHARHFVKRLEGHSLQAHTSIRESRAVVSIGPLASADHPIRRNLAQLPDDGREATLGFSICQALIEQAGGSLQMDPASSLGFRIDLEYPLARATQESPRQTAVPLGRTSRGIRSGPMTALVVSPDEEVRRVILQQLAEQNVRAIPAPNCESAAATCEKLQIEWVFCELSLPNGSGVELYETVRDHVERFVFVGENATFSANPTAFHAPDKATLTKPVEVSDLEALIEELQGRPVAHDA